MLIIQYTIHYIHCKYHWKADWIAMCFVLLHYSGLVPHCYYEILIVNITLKLLILSIALCVCVCSPLVPHLKCEHLQSLRLSNFFRCSLSCSYEVTWFCIQQMGGHLSSTLHLALFMVSVVLIENSVLSWHWGNK